MKEQFQSILSKAKKSERSRLEPYRELIEQLRERGLTYRDISAILTKELQIPVPKSTVNDFVRAQARERKNAARRLSRRESASTPAVPLRSPLHSTESYKEIRKKIADLKAKKPAVEPAPDGFHYDPDEPLRLINPDKRKSYD
jgi:DNA-binding transcriptional MerR regulator